MVKWFIWLISSPFYRLSELDPAMQQTWMKDYSIKLRCLNCDVGQPWAAKAGDLPAGYSFSSLPLEDQVCSSCGAPAVNTTKWVGRRYWGRWQWVDADKLPKSIRPSDLELLAQANK